MRGNVGDDREEPRGAASSEVRRSVVSRAVGTFDAGHADGPQHAWEFWKGHWADLTSMPSSHTTFAAAMAAFLAFAYAPLRGLVVVLTILVAVARVLLGAHYPSEVLVGAAIGWFGGTLGMQVVFRLNREPI